MHPGDIIVGNGDEVGKAEFVTVPLMLLLAARDLDSVFDPE